MKVRVFVSSNQQKPEDFIGLRKIAREVIEGFEFMEPWIFELEEASSQPLKSSYLDPLRDSDIVVLILGIHLTPAVEEEYREAKRLNRRIVLILKDVPERDEQVKQLIAQADVKYARFGDENQFRVELRRALQGECARALRSPMPVISDKSDSQKKIERQLRVMLAEHKMFHVRPMFPPQFNIDLFDVNELDDESVVVKKTSGHLVTIPLDHLTVVSTGQASAPLVQVDGRIQWLSGPMIWQFLPERPQDGFGIGKYSSPGAIDVNRLQKALRAKGYESQWNFEHEATRDGYQVAYDDDGYYLRTKARDQRGDQIFAVRVG